MGILLLLKSIMISRRCIFLSSYRLEGIIKRKGKIAFRSGPAKGLVSLLDRDIISWFRICIYKDRRAHWDSYEKPLSCLIFLIVNGSRHRYIFKLKLNLQGLKRELIFFHNHSWLLHWISVTRSVQQLTVHTGHQWYTDKSNEIPNKMTLQCSNQSRLHITRTQRLHRIIFETV